MAASAELGPNEDTARPHQPRAGPGHRTRVGVSQPPIPERLGIHERLVAWQTWHHPREHNQRQGPRDNRPRSKYGGPSTPLLPLPALPVVAFHECRRHGAPAKPASRRA